MIEMFPRIEGQALSIDATDAGEILGTCKGILEPEGLRVTAIDCGDMWLTDGLLRAALHSAALRGIERAVFEAGDFSMLRRLGFVQDDKNTLHGISQFLTTCKNCGK